MNVSLVLVTDDGKQMDVALHKPVQVIGRQTDVAIRIPSASVSRHHCEIAVTDAGVTVRDLGSSNGTFVNRKRVTQHTLSAGDLISVGDKVFVVRIDGRPESIDAEDAYDDGYVAPPSAGAVAKAPAKAPAKPASPKQSPPPAQPAPLSSEDSSVADFDFLDEDDDIKKQPKL